MNKKKREVEYRYYEMPDELPVLALLGNGWIRPYGEQGLDALHFHNHLEIGYCYEGHGTLVVEEKQRAYGPGTFSFIPHHVCHTTVSDCGMLCRNEYLFVDVESFLNACYEDDPRFSERLIGLVNRRSLIATDEEKPEIARLILALIEEMRQKKTLWAISARGLLLSLLIQVARCAEDDEDRDDALEPPKPDAQLLVISQALGYVSAHYAEEIRISTLAACCHMSETHFRRVFSEIMSLGPLEYVHLVRIETACALLRTTDYSIETIARRVGYPTMTTFDRNFRRVTASTPMQWKKKSDRADQKLRNYRIAAFQGWR